MEHRHPQRSFPLARGPQHCLLPVLADRLLPDPAWVLAYFFLGLDKGGKQSPNRDGKAAVHSHRQHEATLQVLAVYNGFPPGVSRDCHSRIDA